MAIGRVGSGHFDCGYCRVTGRVGSRVGRVRVTLFFRVDSDFGSFGSRVGSGLGHLSFGLFRVMGRVGLGSSIRQVVASLGPFGSCQICFRSFESNQIGLGLFNFEIYKRESINIAYL